VKPRVVFATRSRLSGRIRVVDTPRERRLVVEGAVLSAIPRDGDWGVLRREYWWQALAAVPLPPRPRALLVGLGGGTQVHLLRAHAQPRAITVIERDPLIVRVADAYFGLGDGGALEIVCAEALEAAAGLARARRRFDFVMEDAAYGDAPDTSLALARAVAPLVAPHGVLVVNRHRRGDARALARALRPEFATVTLRHVRREAENVLVCAAGRHPARRARAAGAGRGAPPPAATPSGGHPAVASPAAGRAETA
jgi:spermidine synthase